MGQQSNKSSKQCTYSFLYIYRKFLAIYSYSYNHGPTEQVFHSCIKECTSSHKITPFLLQLQQSTKTTLSKMNKLIFLTGLLTALLSIGTANRKPYYREEMSELEQQLVRALMQDSDVVMETFDEQNMQVARILRLIGLAMRMDDTAKMQDDRDRNHDRDGPCLPGSGIGGPGGHSIGGYSIGK